MTDPVTPEPDYEALGHGQEQFAVRLMNGLLR